MKRQMIETYLGNFDFKKDVIKEENEHGEVREKILLKGILQKANTLNQNGRIYPKNILEREVRNYQKFIKERRAYGELDHPDTSVVSLKNASHIVTEARMDGDVVKGTIEVLTGVPSGKILKGLVEQDVKIGISSRGVGTVVQDGDHLIVQDDYILVCFDVVSEPSTPQAFMIPECKIISEADEKLLKKFFTKSDRIDRIVNDILYGRK